MYHPFADTLFWRLTAIPECFGNRHFVQHLYGCDLWALNFLGIFTLFFQMLNNLKEQYCNKGQMHKQHFDCIALSYKGYMH